MLIEKSNLDLIKIKETIETDVIIVDYKHFDLRSLIKQMINKNIFLLVLTDHRLSLIIDAEDILKFQAAESFDLERFFFKKSIPLLSENLTLGDFFRLYEHEPCRYFGVSNEEEVIGFIDKNKLVNLYGQVDQENHRLITSILDNIDDGVCIVDTTNRVKYWNKSAEKLYEVPRNKILNHPLIEFFPTPLLPKVLLTEEGVKNIYNNPRENTHNLTTANPLYSNGVLIGAISYDKDISEQIKITESLKATQSNLEVLKSELVHLGEQRHLFSHIVGKDPKWLEIIKITKMVSKASIPILISGESGTGKEVLARAIHVESQRTGYFVPINCSAIPKDLFESELFGYESGAFSGASIGGKKGKFEFATKGTLFLDEIGDMPIEMQAKLLRVLEEGTVTPIGGNVSIKIDVRVIGASNKDLIELSQKGLFRKDLYYRLNGIGVELPPLRERSGDISLLALHFLKDYKDTYGYPRLSIPDDILSLLESYHWEGNIRELKNIVERMVILSKNNHLETITMDFLPDVIRNTVLSKQIGPMYSLNDLLERTEKKAICEALSKARSKAEAAKLLKIPRSTLYFKMDKYKMKKTSTN
jgi:transcriptional regulator with PAS, ATPase and Fis domain